MKNKNGVDTHFYPYARPHSGLCTLRTSPLFVTPPPLPNPINKNKTSTQLSDYTYNIDNKLKHMHNQRVWLTTTSKLKFNDPFIWKNDMSTRSFMVRICLFFALAFVLPGCSDDVPSDKGPTTDTGHDSLDTSRPDPPDIGSKPDTQPDTSDVISDAEPNDANTDTDLPDLDPRFEVCLLGTNSPASPDCLPEDHLNFGWLPLSSMAEQTFRVTNTGTDSFWVSGLEVTNSGATDAQIETQSFRLKTNPTNPNQPEQETQTVPARLLPGESLFVDVRIISGTIVGVLQAEAVIADLDLGEANPTVVVIPLMVEIGECEVGTLSCDGLAATGCETNTLDDANNCGGCNIICDLSNVDAMCVAGTCKMDGQCSPGFDNCDKDHANGCEVNILSDDLNCGLCGNSCARDNADGSCDGSAKCNITCHTNFDDCNGDLFESASDGCEVFLPESVNHCGACGNKCNLLNAAPTCTDSACAIETCNTGYDNCDGIPTNGCEIHTDADVIHCGACGNKCNLPNAVAKCSAGGCEIQSCHTGFSDCDNDPSNGCEVNLTNDADHCGSCTTACSLPGGNSICVNSSCRIDTCEPGLANCSIDASAGCQTNVHDDANNCGACGQVCNLPNSGATCNIGACKVTTCTIGYDNCDGNNLTGCEINTASDPNNCGACGNKCNLPHATAKCSTGGCAIESCHEGWSDCDGNPTNGCETNLNSLNNCGQCGNTCNLDNATASCTNQECIVKTCAVGFSNCNGDHADGCETNLKSDDNNCGTCAKVCSAPNAGSTCSAGECAITSCAPGFGDCTAAPGCESHLPTDLNNCGTCGTTCNFPNAAPVCNGGSCGIGSCIGNFKNCDGQLANGCESNTKTDVNNCGGCGIACNMPNANPICTDGGCRIGSCHAGFSDCDGNPANGCEVNTVTDTNNCGTCNNKCVLNDATASCQNSTCAVSACNPGHANCDGQSANGCEIDTYTNNQSCGGCGTICAIPNAAAQCQAPGSCGFIGCNAGFLDLNNNLNDGCEYQCTPTPGEDRPQDFWAPGYNWMNHDKNCDGLDGDASFAFFVATDGSDSAPGTRTQPFKTIQKAINLIASSSTQINQIYVANGTYNEQLTLKPGIAIYGGFSRTSGPYGWARSPAHITEIYNPTADSNRNVIAITGTNILAGGSNPTVLQNIKIRSADATGLFGTTTNGASSYGIHCVNCPGLSIIGNEITAGNGALGVNGVAGARGNNGSTGSNGGNGDYDGPNRGPGGNSGASCNPGGKGGTGAPQGNKRGDDGARGNNGTGAGGAGGAGGDGGGPVGLAGKPGDNGTVGGSTNTRGSNGTGGTNADYLLSNYWYGVSGGNAAQGSHGFGGGGGGGGGGQNSVWPIAHLSGAGNGGGGGGGGACGGNGGQGGSAGGSSFGIFLFNSTGITLQNNVISTNNGGKGGNGGSDGAAGNAGTGGAGATLQTNEIGAGGKGGNGGTGGPGGYGGGGAGGHSIPVMSIGTTLPSVVPQNTLIPGTAGNGGTSAGNNGNAGRAQVVYSI